MGAPYIYDISRLRVKFKDLSYVDAVLIIKIQYNLKASLNLQYIFVMAMYSY